MKITRKRDEHYNELTTISADSEESIILCISLKHYLGLVHPHLPEKDVVKIVSMIEVLERG